MVDRDVVEIRCAGDSREMGFIQGAGARDRIRAAYRALEKLEAFRLQQPAWLPYAAYRWMATRKAAGFLRGPLERDDPEAAARLRGLAEGSGLGLGAIYLLNALEPWLSSLSGSTACPGGCSAMAVRGVRSATGEPMIARNFDYVPLVQPFYIVRESRPRGGLRSLEFTMTPLGGAVDGLNEAGLCITYNYAFSTDGLSEPTRTISMAICDALASCRTTAEAAERIAGRPRCGGGILMICDEGGDIASLELSATRSYLRRPESGSHSLFHTNAFVGDAMREIQLPHDAVYTNAAPTPLRGRRVHQSSEERDGRFRELLAGEKALGVEEIQTIMSDHGPTGSAGDFTICMHGSYWFTTGSLQFFPRSRRIRVAYDTACRAVYREAYL